MGKPNFDEFLSGIPDPSKRQESPDDIPLSEQADQPDTDDKPDTNGLPNPSNVSALSEESEVSEQSDQPDQIANANQLEVSTQPTQTSQPSQSENADQPSQSNQSSQSDNADQPEQSNQSKKLDNSNQLSQSNQFDNANQSDQPGELITFSVRMPTEYIDAIKAIAWWERCTQRAFLEQAVDRYRKQHGGKHVEKIKADYNTHNS